MSNRMRPRLSFANVISMVALFIALGGAAYALSTNSVKSRHIAKGAVKGSDLRSNAVKAKHVRDGKLGGADLADGGVGGADLADGGVGGADLADGGVGSADIAQASVEGRHVVQSTLDELETGAGVAELDGQPALDSTIDEIIATSVTVDEPKTAFALATIEAEATGGVPERVGCRLEIAGVTSGDVFAHTIPSTATADEATITVSFARAVPAGVHPVSLGCRQIDGAAVFVEDGWLSTWAAG